MGFNLESKKEEKIRIYFSDDFDENVVDEITEAFNKIVPTRGISNAQFAQDSIDSQIVQIAFMVVIFVGGGIVTGFFNSIGSDLKEKLAQALRNKKKAVFKFTMSYKNIRIDINAKPESEEEWDRIIDTIDKTGKMAINEIEKDNKINGLVINYDVNVNGYWNLDKY
jgi:hypothetical protein